MVAKARSLLVDLVTTVAMSVTPTERVALAADADSVQTVLARSFTLADQMADGDEGADAMATDSPTSEPTSPPQRVVQDRSCATRRLARLPRARPCW